MLRMLVFAVSLTIGNSAVFAQADWDWQSCNDGRDPVAAIAVCTRLIDDGVSGELGLVAALYSRGVHFKILIERLRTSPERSTSNRCIPALTMRAGMLTTKRVMLSTPSKTMTLRSRSLPDMRMPIMVGVVPIWLRANSTVPPARCAGVSLCHPARQSPGSVATAHCRARRRPARDRQVAQRPIRSG